MASAIAMAFRKQQKNPTAAMAASVRPRTFRRPYVPSRAPKIMHTVSVAE